MAAASVAQAQTRAGATPAAAVAKTMLQPPLVATAGNTSSPAAELDDVLMLWEARRNQGMQQQRWQLVTPQARPSRCQLLQMLDPPPAVPSHQLLTHHWKATPPPLLPLVRVRRRRSVVQAAELAAAAAAVAGLMHWLPCAEAAGMELQLALMHQQLALLAATVVPEGDGPGAGGMPAQAAWQTWRCTLGPVAEVGWPLSPSPHPAPASAWPRPVGTSSG